VDHPPPHHFRLRDRAVCRDLRWFFPAVDRIRPRSSPPGAAHPDRGGGGRPRHHRHAGATGRGVGVAELEVSSTRPGRRHDLRALDAHSEAAPGRRCADLDRGLEGGRPHRRRRPLRWGGGRSEGQAAGRSQGPGTPGRARGHPRSGCSGAPKAPAPPTRRREWAAARDPRRRRPPCGPGGPARACLRRPQAPAPPAAGRLQLGRYAGWGNRSEPGVCPGATSNRSAGGRGSAWWPQPGDPAPAPDL